MKKHDFWKLLKTEFPVDTPLVLRLDKDAYGKKPFQSRSETARLLVRVVSKKWTNGSAAELHETRQIPPEWAGPSGYISARFAIGSSDFFSFSDDDFVYTDPEANSALTRLAAGPSDLDLLGWSAFFRSRSLPPSGESHAHT